MPQNVEWHSRILLSTAEIIVQLIYEYGAALFYAYFNIIIITISFVKKRKLSSSFDVNLQLKSLKYLINEK